MDDTPNYNRVLLAAKQKLERGERLTPEERKEFVNDEGVQFVNEMNRILRECSRDPGGDKVCSYTQGTHDGLKCAISFLFGRMMKISAIDAQKREALEDRIAVLESRIAALEPAAKPRQRVKAPIRLVT
jgi:hypothetical protein